MPSVSCSQVSSSFRAEATVQNLAKVHSAAIRNHHVLDGAKRVRLRDTCRPIHRWVASRLRAQLLATLDEAKLLALRGALLARLEGLCFAGFKRSDAHRALLAPRGGAKRLSVLSSFPLWRRASTETEDGRTPKGLRTPKLHADRPHAGPAEASCGESKSVVADVADAVGTAAQRIQRFFRQRSAGHNLDGGAPTAADNANGADGGAVPFGGLGLV
eukprot:5725223-Prymnesium_polylepis.1